MTLVQNVAERLTKALDLEDERSSGKEITNPKILLIAEKLNNNLLLVEPTLRWIMTKEAEMAGATLAVLYTPAELEEMRAKLT